MRKKRKSPEYEFHCKVATTLNDILDPILTCWSSIENSNNTGGISGMIKQAKNRRKGVKPGVPDLFILYDGKALFIELKALKGTVSDPQKLFHKKINMAGSHIIVIRSISELMDALIKYKIPLVGTYEMR